MKKTYLLWLAGGIVLTSCQSPAPAPKAEETTYKTAYAGLMEQAKNLFGTLPTVAENPANPITDQKVKLGHMLYYDVSLSKGKTQSCNTCHNLNTFGVDNLPTSPGDNGGFGTRNSPTVLNAALHFKQFWDGREPDVEAQAGGPVLNPVEMAMPNEKEVIKRLSANPTYQTMFAEAFPGEKQPITYDNMKKAIGAFERKLITPSPFDAFLAGKEDALTENEKAGLDIYIKVGCTTCHMGNALGGNMFQKFGIFADYRPLTKSTRVDNGIFDLTKKDTDKDLFKVPSMRNIAKTSPYFHDGSVADLGEAVKIMAKTELNKDLSPEEIKSIVSFLNTLTGEVPADFKKDPFAKTL